MMTDRPATDKIIDLTPHLARRRRARRREILYTLLALWSQYLSLGTLLAYALLRLTLCAQVPLGRYSGPLSLLWPLAYALLLISYVSDHLLWRDEWA